MLESLGITDLDKNVVDEITKKEVTSIKFLATWGYYSHENREKLDISHEKFSNKANPYTEKEIIVNPQTLL